MFGILFFSSKSRVQQYGIPFIDCTSHQSFIVNCKKPKHIDMWAKVDPVSHQLMDLIGPTGDYETEVRVLLQLYNISYSYPKLSLFPFKCDVEEIHAFTVDDASTLDRDDAISIHIQEDVMILGIHITDLTRRLDPSYLDWAKTSGSSVYWNYGTKPMLPPYLSHDALSLNQGNIYPCLSLFLTYRDQECIQKRFESTCVFITENKTYVAFGLTKEADLLRRISQKEEPTELIAWAMIQYNEWFAHHVPNILLRIKKEHEPAHYSYAGSHESMGTYTHATSPIRRFVDGYNQFVYRGVVPSLSPSDLDQMNERMNRIRLFHQRETVIRLAYACKHPQRVTIHVEQIEDGKFIRVTLNQRFLWIPLSDAYYHDEICNQIQEGKGYEVDLCGVLKYGKMMLRLRLV